MWIRIQFHIQCFDDQKIYSLIFYIFFDQKLQFTYPKVSLKLQEKPSTSKDNIRHFKAWKFFYFFLFVWVIFALPDTDSDPGGGGPLTEKVKHS